MILSLDVECRGLYGQAFAYGLVLTANDGSTIMERVCACPYQIARWDQYLTPQERLQSDEWLRKNVLPHTEPIAMDRAIVNPAQLRKQFVADLIRVHHIAGEEGGGGLLILADVPFPCETQFLREVRNDNPEKHGPLMPYPLLDLASSLAIMGHNPVGTYARRDNEQPAHNPLSDARQASRIYHQLMRGETIK